jgi:hypothetical protein
VGAHISVVGRNHVTPADPPFGAKSAASDDGDGGCGSDQGALIESYPAHCGFCAAGRRVMRPGVTGFDTAFEDATFESGWEAGFRVLFAKHCGAPHVLTDYARPEYVLTEPFSHPI